MTERSDIGIVNVSFCMPESRSPNEVIAQLIERFHAVVTCRDCYADRRRNALQLIAWHEKAGKPIPNPQIVLDDMERKAMESGVRVGIAVPMEGGGYMIGNLSRRGLLLAACCPLKDSDSAKAVVAFLESLNIVNNVEIT